MEILRAAPSMSTICFNSIGSVEKQNGMKKKFASQNHHDDEIIYQFAIEIEMPYTMCIISFSYDDPINNRRSSNNEQSWVRARSHSFCWYCAECTSHCIMYTLQSFEKLDDISRCLLLLGISNWIAAILLRYWWIVRFSYNRFGCVFFFDPFMAFNGISTDLLRSVFFHLNLVEQLLSRYSLSVSISRWFGCAAF